MKIHVIKVASVAGCMISTSEDITQTVSLLHMIYPTGVEVYATYDIQSNPTQTTLNNIFGCNGLNSVNGWIYLISPEDAFNKLRAIAALTGTESKLVKLQAVESIVQDNKSNDNTTVIIPPSIKTPAPPKDKKRKIAPPFKFKNFNIVKGTKLVWIPDPTKECTVAGENTEVIYNGKFYSSISGLDKELANYHLNRRGPAYFALKSSPTVPLTELREEAERKEAAADRKHYDFKMLGIKPGTTLTWARDHKITCVTVDDTNLVRYEYHDWTISNLARFLDRTDNPRNGYNYFELDGKLLIDLRKEKVEENKVPAVPATEIVDRLGRSLPTYSFSSLGIGPGSVLYYLPDMSKTCIVVDDTHVSFKGVNYTLYSLDKMIGGTGCVRFAPAFFLYKGKKLADIQAKPISLF